MIVRDAKLEDFSKLRKMHSDMRMVYPFPDLVDELTALVQVVDDGNIVAGGAVKIIGEAYLFLDPFAPLGVKLKAIRELNVKMAATAKEKGFTQISAWIPEQIEGAFTHLLEGRGWQKSPWRTWTRNL